MALTPDDIVNYEFKQAVRGYAIPQVDDLLDRLADQVERSEREIDDLRQRLRDTEARLGSTLETEATLKRTLVTAQQAAERALEDARMQADELRTAAEREINELLQSSRKEADEITQRARDEADELLSQSRAEADEVTGRARAEAEELTGRAHAEAEELTGRARAEAEQLTRQAREEFDELTARAQQAARAEVQSAREERAALESRLGELREMEARHRSILRRHLESNLTVLERFDEELPAPDEAEILEPVTPAASPGLQVRVRQDEAGESEHQGDDGGHGDHDPALEEDHRPSPDDEPHHAPFVSPRPDGRDDAFGDVGEAQTADAGTGDPSFEGQSYEDPSYRGSGYEGAGTALEGAGYGGEGGGGDGAALSDAQGGDAADAAAPQMADHPEGVPGQRTDDDDVEREGLFDHDDIDISEEVAVPSPWEPAADDVSSESPRGDDSSRSGEDAWEAPSPWVQQTSLPPPDVSQREDDGLASNGSDQDDTVGQDGPAAHPKDETREHDPYEHYDRFREFRQDER